MIRPHRAVLLALFLLLPACSAKTRPPQVFPGFEHVPADRLATVRESDSVYISSIDLRNAPEPESDMPYRQFQIPGGRHLFAIYYHSSSGVSHSYNYLARVEPGHTYSFNTKVESNFLNVVGVSTKHKWTTALVDDATGQPASTQPTTAPTTRPRPESAGN